MSLSEQKETYEYNSSFGLTSAERSLQFVEKLRPMSLKIVDYNIYPAF